MYKLFFVILALLPDLARSMAKISYGKCFVYIKFVCDLGSERRKCSNRSTNSEIYLKRTNRGCATFTPRG